LAVTAGGTRVGIRAMPRLPPLGTGLAPVLQWALLPPLALLVARRIVLRAGDA